MTKSSKLKILALSIGLVFAIPAQAYTITGPFAINPSGNPAGQDGYSVTLGAADIGSSFDLNWFLAAGAVGDAGVTPGDFSAEATFTLNAFDTTSNFLNFGVSITNTTLASAGFDNAGITSLGFGADPTATGANLLTGGTYFDGITPTGANSPAFDINTCIWSANNCSGGAQGDLLAIGDTDSFIFQLLFSDLSGGSVTLDTFGLKTQTSVGSFELAGLPTNPNDPPNPEDPPTTVPEPASLMLLGVGLLGFFGASRRKAKAA